MIGVSQFENCCIVHVTVTDNKLLMHHASPPPAATPASPQLITSGPNDPLSLCLQRRANLSWFTTVTPTPTPAEEEWPRSLEMCLQQQVLPKQRNRLLLHGSGWGVPSGNQWGVFLPSLKAAWRSRQEPGVDAKVQGWHRVPDPGLRIDIIYHVMLLTLFWVKIII